MPLPSRRTPILAALAICLAAPAPAQDLDAQYSLSMRGISGGRIAMKGRESDDAYAVSAAASSSGIVGLFVSYRYDGQAQGVVQGGRHVSTRYVETEDDSGDQTQTVTRFQGTTPRDVTITPEREPRPWDVDPTAQRGVVDPLTALYLLLRDTPPAGACAQQHDMFDGRHVTRLSIGPAQPAADGTIRCAGEYRYLAGFKPEDMAEREVTALTFLYTPVGDGTVRVTEVRSRTGLGEGVLRRQ